MKGENFTIAEYISQRKNSGVLEKAHISGFSFPLFLSQLLQLISPTEKTTFVYIAFICPSRHVWLLFWLINDNSN